MPYARRDILKSAAKRLLRALAIMKHSSLEVKIHAGFALIVGLFLLTGLVSSQALSQLGASRDDIRDVEMANASALVIDRDVQELRRRVDRYVAAGGERQLEAINDIHQRVVQELEAASAQTSNAEMLTIFAQIRNHVEQYASNIPTIETQRNLRRSLVQVELPRQADRVEAAFDAVADVVESNPADGLLLARGNTLFLQAERSISRYFDNPDTDIVNTAVAYFAASTSTVRSLGVSSTGRAHLIEQIDEFERIALRAAQATRNYLFFFNVAMAGEASEVAYYAALLRNFAAQRRAQISSAALATSRNTTRFTATMMALALTLTLLIAARLAFLIVPPVTMLTRLFEKLAGGATNIDIPDSDRDDEIGRMTKAARSFSDRNRKTRELLAESEALRGQLECNSAKLEASNKELDDFAYVASHDLQSPLRSIRQLATWVGEDAADVLPADSLKQLNLLIARITKMDRLLEDLLNSSRAGRAEPEVQAVDMAQLLASTIELTDNPNNVQIVFASDLPTVSVVAPPLEQVLRNMIGNSVKHCDKGASGRVEITLAIEGNRCRFRIADNGPGIAPADHVRAFQMYQRAGNAKVAGSGMGLAIIKKQVEARGGRVTLRSELGAGATFEFTWPIESVHYDTQQRKAS